MPKLKFKYFGHLILTDSLEKTLMLEGLKAGGERDNRGWDDWAPPTQWTWVWASSGSWWWTGKPCMLQSVGLQSRTWLSDWTKTTHSLFYRWGNWGTEGLRPVTLYQRKGSQVHSSAQRQQGLRKRPHFPIYIWEPPCPSTEGFFFPPEEREPREPFYARL